MPVTIEPPAPPPPLVGSTAMTVTASSGTGAGHCPELVWRQIRWPSSEAGSVLQMPCPAHAHSDAPSEPYPASLSCLANGQWARHVQAGRCQSLWLRNLTQRLEAGDSPLSVLAELASRTHAGSGSQVAVQQQQLGLFGDDVVQISRIIKRLVDEMGEMLSRISDDRQRVSYAREMVQLIAEIVGGLSHEQHAEAWLDLASQLGERQRTAGQLVVGLEQAAVLMAGALGGQEASSSQQHLEATNEQAAERLPGNFLKVTENSYVAIRSLAAAAGPAKQALEVTFPSPASVLGTRWMDSEQSFTLHLQTQAELGSQLGAAAHQLRLVFVMLRNLGAHMGPPGNDEAGTQRLAVSSDLVSMSIVADARKSVKVDLSAPIELVFRHAAGYPRQQVSGGPPTDQHPAPAAARRPAQCVYWDQSSSNWLADGCKLLESNGTHSTCACNHLTTFALLADWDDDAGQLQQQPLGGEPNSWMSRPLGRQQQFAAPRVQLDSVENELILANKALYLAKLLDGNLFQGHAPSARLALYASCLLAALLLAAQLAASAYGRAHARRLLSSLPAEPPPSLLVANQSHQIGQQQPQPAPAGAIFRPGTSGRPLASAADSSPPTYSSDYSVKGKLSRPHEASYDCFASSLSVATPAGPLRPDPTSPEPARGLAAAPVHLIIKMLALELLLVFLIESQNFLQRRPIASGLGGPEPLERLNPTGPTTWLLVLALYYLVASLTFWLLAQLLQLNGQLASSTSACSSSARSDQQQRQQQQVYGPAGPLRPLAAANLYGQHASASPTSSFSSSPRALAAEASSAAALGRLEADSARLYLALNQTGTGPAPPERPRFAGRAECLRGLSQSRALCWGLVHLGPLLAAAGLGLLSLERAQSINQLAYTSTSGAQLALWPLLVDASWTLPLGLLLYALPAICLALGLSALLGLRKLLRKLPAGGPYGLQQQQHQQQALNKQQSMEQSPATGEGWPPTSLAAKSRRAKFACLTLLALLATHSICWIAFFAHCRRALNTPPSAPTPAPGNPSISSNNNNTGSDGNHLIWTLAASNLLLTTLCVWSQRRSARRALQLAGLPRLLGGCFRRRKGPQGGGLYGAATTAGSPSDLGLAPNAKLMKLSPSSQSLFVIARQRQQHLPARHAHPGCYAAYQPQQQQHLYQQLAASQHIYDSTSNLSGEQQLSALQLIQQQQRGVPFQQMNHPFFHQQEQAFTLNRSLGSQLHLQNQLAELQRPAMTLKPQSGAMFAASQQQQLFLCPNPANHQDKQRGPGEADGPLVALSSASSNSSTTTTTASQRPDQQAVATEPASATFGPIHSHSVSGPQQHQQQQHHNQQRHIFKQAIEHRPFRQDLGQPAAGLCASGALTSGGPLEPGGQLYGQQRSGQQMIASSKNYSDALRAAMMQEAAAVAQQAPGCQQHFRRSNSKQHRHRPMIDGDLASAKEAEAGGNIYDVANYAMK